jgi:hypothetical protein
MPANMKLTAYLINPPVMEKIAPSGNYAQGALDKLPIPVNMPSAFCLLETIHTVLLFFAPCFLTPCRLTGYRQMNRSMY